MTLRRKIVKRPSQNDGMGAPSISGSAISCLPVRVTTRAPKRRGPAQKSGAKLKRTDCQSQLFTEDSEDLKSGGDDAPGARTPHKICEVINIFHEVDLTREQIFEKQNVLKVGVALAAN